MFLVNDAHIPSIAAQEKTYRFRSCSQARIQLFLACSQYRQNHKQQKLVVREGVDRTNEMMFFCHDIERGAELTMLLSY